MEAKGSEQIDSSEIEGRKRIFKSPCSNKLLEMLFNRSPLKVEVMADEGSEMQC